MLSKKHAALGLAGVIVCGVMTACSTSETTTPTAMAPVIDTPALTATATPVPDASAATEAYLRMWAASDYAGMYALLAAESRAALTAEDFEARYRKEMEILTALAVSGQVTDVSETGDVGQATARVSYDTYGVGQLETDLAFSLKRENGQWRIVFTPASIWPDLVNGQQLLMAPLTTERGSLYDRNGAPLAAPADAYAVGLIPGLLGEGDDANNILKSVARLLDTNATLLGQRLEGAVPDQYFALGEVSAADIEGFRFLFDIPAVTLTGYNDRYYPSNGAAAHVTGYTSFITSEEVDEYRRRGYTGSERVGRTGIEAWGEQYLGGKPGWQLQLRDANNTFIRMIASTPQTPAQDIYTTIDFDLQQAAQFALGDFTGGIVILNLNTGEVLALASTPTFSANLFSPYNRNASSAAQILADPRKPQLNHAAQSAYPAGSVFKIVTLSAALTSGLFQPDTLYTCNGEWNETSDPNFTRKDWKEGGHGELTLIEGLSASCNPWFWHMGYALFNWNPNWLTQTAQAFGLGQPTNIGQIEENAGQIPGPEWKQQTQGEVWSAIDGLNLSIGQGDVLVTPLQIARIAAAVGNGGTLYTPQLVKEIRPAEEGAAATFTFAPIISGTLPLEPEQLAALQEGMRNVPREPIGTARERFKNFRICVAGKTGTAEDPGLFGTQEPDAWFTGYTCQNNPDLPDIAIAVVVQNAGQGSDYAAPIFRRVVEAYFGLNYTRYPWEESIGIPRREEPTPVPGTETATPSP
ncbi:MAG: penicillin-binding transpeptidase domain-containing protein [Anaerolineales bacterium]